MMTKTGIVATLGPASAGPEVMRQLIDNGVCTFRQNFSHGTFDDHSKMLRHINQVRKELPYCVSVLGDLCGPKIRTGQVEPGTVLEKDREVTITVSDEIGNPSRITTNYAGFIRDVQSGQRILIDDGSIVLGVNETTTSEVKCRVLVGGPLSSRKGINLPDSKLSIPPITEKDWQCVDWAIENDLDFLALSFVQQADEIQSLKDYLTEKGSRIRVIAKIEKPLAVQNIESIISVSDGIMVARGDLGVEMDLAQVPLVQKKITGLCRRLGKPVIVATQVLQSMIENASPTRAEATDVSNAVLEYADAVMLSGESAVGKYPVESVKWLSHICKATESYIEAGSEPRPRVQTAPDQSGKEAVARAVAQMLDEIKAAYVVSWTESGNMARLLSKARIDVPIIAVCPDALLARQLSLSYGIISIHKQKPDTLAEWVKRIEKYILENGWANIGDKLLIIPPNELLSPQNVYALTLHIISA